MTSPNIYIYICYPTTKLQSIEKLLVPKTPKKVKQMLGLTGYYHKFIPVYADLV